MLAGAMRDVRCACAACARVSALLALPDGSIARERLFTRAPRADVARPTSPAPLLSTMPPCTACVATVAPPPSPPRKKPRMGAGGRALDLRTPPTLASSHAKSRARARDHGVHARNRHWVFVYGTLKRGFPNQGLLAGSTYLGEFRTLTPYPLVVGTHPPTSPARTAAIFLTPHSWRLLLPLSARYPGQGLARQGRGVCCERCHPCRARPL